tara:strand:- start:322 stop:678 length:357 start_codon:yes stop_codon:yes gene_type:complete
VGSKKNKMKDGLAIIISLALLFPLTSSAKQIKNYESELIVIHGDILATRNLTKEPNPDFIGWYIRITPEVALKINEVHFNSDDKMSEKIRAGLYFCSSSYWKTGSTLTISCSNSEANN